MRNPLDIRLGHYDDERGRHELHALLDELTLTYHVVARGPDGRVRRLKAHLRSLQEARRWVRAFRGAQA
jgi:hypothetical protein